MHVSSLAMLASIAGVLAPAQLRAAVPDSWRQPFPAHRIIGNVYYVGTDDLACFLITTPQGHILINTGLADSAPLIRSSVESLGFRLRDIKILLTMQAHLDHVGAMAEMQRLTGAMVLATEGDAPVLADGGRSDYLFFKNPAFWFKPVQPARRLRDGEVIRLGGAALTVHVTPGHTKGSATYTMPAREAGREYNVVFANIGSINPGVRLVGNPRYPEIARDYARTFRVQKALPCDIFLAAHASQYRLHEKYRPGQAYDPQRFVDPDGYRAKVEEAERAYNAQLAKEDSGVTN